MTFVLVGRRGSGNSLVRKELTSKENLALQALFPLPRGPRPAREFPRKFRSLGLPPSFFCHSGGQDKGGGFRVHLVLCPERLPPFPLGLGRARGGSVSGFASVARERASVSSAPSGAGEGEVARSRRTPPARAALPLPAPLPRLLLPAHRSTLRDVMSREKFRRTAPLLDPPAFPVLQSKEHGRIVELALGRTALVTVAVVLALNPLPVRGQEVESVGGVHLLGRCPPASGRAAIGSVLRIAPALGACALVLGETGLDPRIVAGLAKPLSA